jgi:hypothetical protein
MNRKEPRLRIPVALAVAVIAVGAAAYGCKNQCTMETAFGGGPTNPDGGQAGAGGTPDCATTATSTDIG